MSAATVITPPLSGSELERGKGYYRSGNQAVQPADDAAIVSAYSRFRDEGLLPWLFYETPEPLSLFDFLTIYRRAEHHTLGCFRENPETLKWDLCGLMWFNSITAMGPNHKRANTGMGFYRGFTDPDFLVRFAHLGMAWSFEQIGVDALQGVTPAKNRAALAFSKRSGFHLAGPVAGSTVWRGELSDTYISSLTKERWEKEVSPWKERTGDAKAD